MQLTELLSGQELILLDGAMGTQLAEHGLEMGGQNNLTHPETVLEIHRRYAACGVHLLITNTLTMNRVYIERYRLDVDVREVNRAGVALARSAAGPDQLILGDLSSTGALIEPYGALPEATAFAAFHEQATILAEAGVDGFIIETMFSLREALCALRACRMAAPLPTIVSLAFKTIARGGRTLLGDSAKTCAEALTEAGASAIGANCGDLAPSQVALVVSSMREATPLPLLAQPNAGRPRLVVADRTVFDMTPADFAAGIRECVHAGARLIGGCCGTSPAHISAAAKMLGIGCPAPAAS